MPIEIALGRHLSPDNADDDEPKTEGLSAVEADLLRLRWEREREHQPPASDTREMKQDSDIPRHHFTPRNRMHMVAVRLGNRLPAGHIEQSSQRLRMRKSVRGFPS